MAEQKKNLSFLKNRQAKKKRSYKRLFINLVIVLFVLCGIGAGVFFGIAFSAEKINVDELKMNFTSVIYYEHPETGEPVVLQNLFDDENRIWVDFEDIPDDLKNAFVAIEDERFYKHSGVDIKRTIGAALNSALRIFDRDRSIYGGSTITQQLVKNITQDKDRTLTRKIQEIYRAYDLDSRLSKDEILELYLNTIYLSQQCNGVGSAARAYFGTNVEDLTLAQCASIAGITQYPSLYDPYLNPDANKKKQTLVLSKMLELEMISQSEYDSAIEEELVFTRGEHSQTSSYSYFADTVIDEVLSDLINEHHYSEVMAEKLLYSGGLQIKCTYDPIVQASLDKVYLDDSNFPKTAEDKPIIEGAMVVLESSTGQIKGIVGGRGEKTGSRTLNRAKTLRQPGSTIKPIAVYAPALEYKIVTPCTVIEDEAVTYGNWSPKNSDWEFHGKVTVSEAVARSFNIPAVKVLDQLGIDVSFRFMENNLGITSLVYNRKNETTGRVVSDRNLSSLALGGLTDGLSALELAAAYSTFNNDGIYIAPHSYTEIYDYNGELLFEKEPETHTAMKASVARNMTEMLINVVNGGTGGQAAISGLNVAGKTGTTDNNHDRWFAGFTPTYTGVSWVGYDQPAPLYVYGNPAITPWKLVMAEINQNKPKTFASVRTSNQNIRVKTVSICSQSGLLSTELCEAAETVRSINVTVDIAPVDYCEESYHTEEPDASILPEDVTPDPEASIDPSVDDATATEIPSDIDDPEDADTPTDSDTQTDSDEPTDTPDDTETDSGEIVSPDENPDNDDTVNSVLDAA